MTRLRPWLAVALLICQDGPAPSGVAAAGTVELSTERILAHMRALGDDSMEGRGVGSPGGERAARYLEARLAELGLEPAVGDGFRQAVPLHGSTPLRDSRLRVVSAAGVARELTLWDDYVLFDTSARTFLPRPVPLTFVAYGIVAPEFDHNDYQGLEMAGRIAVILTGEPPSDDPFFFDGSAPTVYSDPEMKFRTALSRGARGAILVPSSREGVFTDWQRVLDAFRTEDVTLPYGISGNLDLLLNADRAELLFDGAEHTFAEVEALDRSGALRSFPLRVEVGFSGMFRERDFVAHNVAARLPGSDPLLASEYLLVSAHYDGLGIGLPVGGDAIFNGVIDNASGTAVVLELARVLAAGSPRPRRSILFLFVTGEEKGLLGSRYYRDHPLVPLHRTVAAINVDGISFLAPTDDFVGVGAELSTLGELLQKTLARLDLRLAEIPEPFRAREPLYASDQIAFAQGGVPSILVMEGLSFRGITAAEGLARFVAWGEERYHSPRDDLSQPLDRQAIEQHATVLLELVREVANTFTQPQWLPGTPFNGERLRSLAEGT